MKTLEEIIKDVLYETHKLSNGQPSIATLERMQGSAKRLAKELDTYMTAKSVENIKEFQKRVFDAFVAMEKELSDLKSEIEKLKNYAANSTSKFRDNRLNNIG